MLNVTFFENVGELRRLTGLTREELWDKGFDLDDMDFGIVCDEGLRGDWWNRSTPYYSVWLLEKMDSHCVGYHHTEYLGKHYYTIHHS